MCLVKFTAPEDRVVHAPGKVTERVTEKENEVLQLIQIDPGYTYTTMAEKLSISRKTVSVRIKSLKDKGIIRRIGSDTNGYWEIISRLN